MSHDIRGPLVSAMAGLQVLLRGSYGGMDAGVSGKLSDLHGHLTRVLGTADDLLAQACCLEGALCIRHEILDLQDDVLGVVLDELASELQNADIRLEWRLEGLPAGTVVVANKFGMRSVFRNLLRNAVKYGGPGSAVVCGYHDEGDHHRFNVYNSGRPIPREFRARLFTRFGAFCTAAAPGKIGVGLGLYLTREIVRAHGGSIRYEARTEGSDFVFTLPKVPALAADNGSSAARRGGSLRAVK